MNEQIIFCATNSTKLILQALNTSFTGLSEQAIKEHRNLYGNNKIVHGKKLSLTKRIANAFINPFTAILFCLAIVSIFTDIIIPIMQNSPDDVNPVTVIIILTMVFISGSLRFVQESRSGNAAEKLLSLITTTCTVTRQYRPKAEIPLEDVVIGDIIHLSAGDMIPADARILEAKDLFISQASLTGESEPVEKLGSNVISGSATAVVIGVGNNTLFGSIASSVSTTPMETNFTKGVNSVSWILIRFMLFMVPIVFFVNGITKNDWVEAFLFAISIAVGLTPEMLPMIVTTCLAKGAVSMSKKKTIVKNLNSIQNFGAMDILCTDKTGTLTMNKVVLEYHLDVLGNEDSRVLRHAYLNSYFQTGYKNLMDIAIINKTEEIEQDNPNLINLSSAYTKVDDIPFDFSRRRLSIVVKDKNQKCQMITKGAVEEMLSICFHVEYQGKIKPLDERIKKEILKTVDKLNDKGMRVIAVAQKNNPSPIDKFSIADECDMVLIGYLAFLDPPKESTVKALKALKEYGVKVKVLTGDNDKVARSICKQVGLKVNNLLLGSDIEQLPEQDLAIAVEKTDVLAKLSPEQKAKIVKLLRQNGHTVGFMGDGINDATAIKSSDIAISVDNAVNITKESADIILLEKDLMVLEQSIIEGRKTYANMIKYIKITAFSNFGNMFSVLIASALLQMDYYTVN